jgi:hypothetical protein
MGGRVDCFDGALGFQVDSGTPYGTSALLLLFLLFLLLFLLFLLLALLLHLTLLLFLHFTQPEPQLFVVPRRDTACSTPKRVCDVISF